MNSRKGTKEPRITDRFIRLVVGRLQAGQRVRRTLPGRGRLHIDRPLPFMCVYRRPRDQDDGTERLVSTEPSYLIASRASKEEAGLTSLVEAIARSIGGQFGAFLIVELWSATAAPGAVESPALQQPRFRIVTPRSHDLGGFSDAFAEALSRIRVRRLRADVEVVGSGGGPDTKYSPILARPAAKSLNCYQVGLEVRPIYRNAESGELYPVVLREVRRALSHALRRAFFKFVNSYTTHRPKHYHVLGRRAVVKAVWKVDRGLASVADSFDFLLQLTPVNSGEAWSAFQRDRFERAPLFHYRPLPVDPALLKRSLYQVPLERLEDPALAMVFREKQNELDRQISMLLDLNTPRAVHNSLSLYGEVDDDLVLLAEDILERLPSRTREDTRSGYLDAHAFAELARAEIAAYREQWTEVDAEVHVRDDVASGLMVSRGNLLIGAQSRIPVRRVEALLQHEVGTHVVTYFNGRAQPFRLLYSGLAGYESLQEGLAVLAEYLVGGLSRPRLRLLAARVVTARHMVDGASFVEAFRELERGLDFDRRTAFTVTMRIFRGGGLTKDAEYLRGLRDLVSYVGRGGALDPLLVGKIAASHVRVIEELRLRRVLLPVPLIPRYLQSDEAQPRLARLREGLTVPQLIEKGRR